MLLTTRDDRLLRSHLRDHLHAPDTVHLSGGSTCGERAAADRLQQVAAAIDRFTSVAAGILSDDVDPHDMVSDLHQMLIDLRDITLFDAGETMFLNRRTEAACSSKS